MRHTKCLKCKGSGSCSKEAFSWVLVIIGIVATIAVRVVTILSDIKPIWGKFAWYVGVIGFIIFFAYKYLVFEQRSRLISERHLIEKINKRENFNEEDYTVVSIMLCDLRSNLERVNYQFIFISSLISLLVAIYLDFFRG
ncbi:MAG: hypothetical protein HQL27_07235 [Candidatus Omnitrophica bacterium]|nr:hypothetical protein [Candidatus Omnitrophota bacterium]